MTCSILDIEINNCFILDIICEEIVLMARLGGEWKNFIVTIMGLKCVYLKNIAVGIKTKM